MEQPQQQRPFAADADIDRTPLAAEDAEKELDASSDYVHLRAGLNRLTIETALKPAPSGFKDPQGRDRNSFRFLTDQVNLAGQKKIWSTTSYSLARQVIDQLRKGQHALMLLKNVDASSGKSEIVYVQQ